MNKKSVLSVLVIVFALLVVGVGVTSAQGRGGNGGSNGDCPNNGICTGTGPGTAWQGGQGNRGNGMGMNNGMGAGQGAGTAWQGGQGNRGNGMGMNNGMGAGACLGTGQCAGLPAAYEGELPQSAIDLMVAGWQDEQTAYALYDGMIAQFGNVRPFANIQRAEAQHIAAWEFLFDRYGIEVPDVPTVSVPDFTSVAAACQAGVEVETTNFALYDQMLASFTDYPDLTQVAQNLRDASEFQHLPALQNCAG